MRRTYLITVDGCHKFIQSDLRFADIKKIINIFYGDSIILKCQDIGQFSVDFSKMGILDDYGFVIREVDNIDDYIDNLRKVNNGLRFLGINKFSFNVKVDNANIVGLENKLRKVNGIGLREVCEVGKVEKEKVEVSNGEIEGYNEENAYFSYSGRYGIDKYSVYYNRKFNRGYLVENLYDRDIVLPEIKYLCNVNISVEKLNSANKALSKLIFLNEKDLINYVNKHIIVSKNNVDFSKIMEYIEAKYVFGGENIVSSEQLMSDLCFVNNVDEEYKNVLLERVKHYLKCKGVKYGSFTGDFSGIAVKEDEGQITSEELEDEVQRLIEERNKIDVFNKVEIGGVGDSIFSELFVKENLVDDGNILVEQFT
jgi:hypothetical protein